MRTRNESEDTKQNSEEGHGHRLLGFATVKGVAEALSRWSRNGTSLLPCDLISP